MAIGKDIDRKIKIPQIIVEYFIYAPIKIGQD